MDRRGGAFPTDRPGDVRAMRKRRSFRPTALGVSTLEDRIALSHGSVAMSAMAPMMVTVRSVGSVVTTLPKGIGGGYSATLTGLGSVPGIGKVNVLGKLSSNPTVAPPYQGVHGTFTLTPETKAIAGEVILTVTGKPWTLQNGTEVLAYKVTTATGVFKAAE